ncbi:MAG TPA: hypothetical protein VGJ29_11170 [Vicinamibacterales bacterium]
MRHAVFAVMLLVLSTAPWADVALAAQAGPSTAAAERLARLEAEQPAAATAAQSNGHRGASRAEKLAWAYLLIGGAVFIVTSPGEKGENGRWSDDGKWEMAGGIGAVAISFALLHDILSQK